MSTQLTSFDVLIVYSERTAYSAGDSSATIVLPFPTDSDNSSLNYVYSYFIESCQAIGLSAAFSTSADITGPGLFSSYWIFVNNVWAKVNAPCYASQIFDKFSPVNKEISTRRKLLFSSKRVQQFNNTLLFDIFFDKQKTYNTLAEFAIPTVTTKADSLVNIKLACRRLSSLVQARENAVDFSGDIIMKDRFGAGGWNVYRLKRDDYASMLGVQQANPNISFILQPFTNFDRGFCYHNRRAATDIRLIYLSDKLVQSYFRMAKTGDFRCNEHQGGSSTYLKLNEIPQRVKAQADQITARLAKQQTLYALDFIIGNSGIVHFIEGNTGPGLSWNKSIKHEAFMAKKLIRQIAKTIQGKITLRKVHQDNHNLKITPKALNQEYIEALYI